MLCLEEYNFVVGTKLLLDLINDGLLEGIFYNGGKDRIDLKDVTFYANNFFTKGPYSVYRSEIKSVRVIKPADLHEPINNHMANSDVILMPKTDYDDLRRMTKDYIYLPMVDKNYYKAIENLNNCENLAVTAITKLYDRFAQLCLLVISSWKQVYIFDVFNYNIPNDLKDILQCSYIMKIVHDARLLVGLLKTQHKIEVVNIFDTMCADFKIQSENKRNLTTNPPDVTTRTVGECLKDYFHFPDSFVTIHKDMNMDDWDDRPLSSEKKILASQSTVYLVYMKHYLEQIMQKKFFDLSSTFAATFQIPIERSKKILAKQLAEIEETLEKID